MPGSKIEQLIDNPDPLLATTARMLEASGKDFIATLLRSADGRLEETDYDNFNGGTTFYTLYLSVNASEVAQNDGQLSNIEETILSRARLCLKDVESASLSRVAIVPRLISDVDWRAGLDRLADEEAKAAIDKIWTPGYFRLFLSHVSRYKKEFSKLKEELLPLGICAFLAHEDIEPSSEWEQAIDLALRSADGLAPLLTEGFRESNWTDQETGIAVARNLVIVPVKYGIDPYGFVGKIQAIPAWLDRPWDGAREIAAALLKRKSYRKVLEGMVVAVEGAKSYRDVGKAADAILKERRFTKDQLRRLFRASIENDQVTGATFSNAKERLQSHIFSISPELREELLGLQNDDDYNPFAEEARVPIGTVSVDDYDPFAEE